MSNKTISNGTLNLRFMQNALRSQQLQQVELERAKVKDEGEWEVGQDIKDAWGIGQGIKHQDPVTHEPSYLPFLFSSDYEQSKPLGRRVFNKKGHDVSKTQSPSQLAHEDGDIPDEEPSSVPNTEETSTKGQRLRVHAKPRSISSLSIGKNLKGFDAFDNARNETQEKEIQRQSSISGLKRKSAMQAIFDMTGVGTDLRSKRKSKAPVNDDNDDVVSSDEDGLKAKQRQEKINQRPATTTGFLKPAGIDEPTPHPASSAAVGKAKHSSSPIPDIIDGARKRTRDTDDQGNEEKKKKKKKKKKKVAVE